MSAAVDPREGPRLPLTTSARSVGWAGVALLCAIELTVMGSLVASYFYLRVGTPLWPPVDAGMPDLVKGFIGQALVMGSAVPVFFAERAWRKHADPRPLGWLLPVGVGLVVAYTGLKVLEYGAVSYHWSSHAYGSINWTMTGYQLLHSVVLVGFAAVVWLFGRIGGLRAQRGMAVESLALYWYFVVVSSTLEFVTTHLSPYVL